jgi:hypothetical protein
MHWAQARSAAASRAIGAPLFWNKVAKPDKIPRAMTVARTAVATVRVGLGEGSFSWTFMAISSSQIGLRNRGVAVRRLLSAADSVL